MQKNRLFHPTVVLVACIGLGATLIYASWHKVTDPPDFAKIIYNYKMFPPSSIHLLAIFFPWFELIAGVALITSIGRRGGAMMAILFFATFIIALSFNLARDCPTICGCFAKHADGTLLTTDEKFFEMKKEVALDVDCPCNVAIFLISCAGPSVKPIRHPVIEYVFDAPWMTKMRSRRSGRSVSTLAKGPPSYRMRL